MEFGSKMLSIVVIALFLCFDGMHRVYANLTVNRVIVRVPRENDIGLIFDLSFVNTQTEKKEILEFQVRSDGTCCVNLTNHKIMPNASRIVGGNFGYIEAGAGKTVSLIWPTVSLFNRVGVCPIIITSTNPKGEEIHMRQTLHFDTRFTSLDPEGHTLRKNKNYIDCNNWDLNYLKNCTPVNCEERYFGRRSFYNSTTQQCDEVPACVQSFEYYDIYANECINSQNFFTEEEMEEIRKGKYDDNILDLKSAALPSRTNGPHVVVNQFTNDGHDKVQHDDSKMVITRNSEIDPTRVEEPSMLPYWLKGLLDGLLIVFTTITIYVLICFVIFLVVSWISRHNFKSDGNKNCAPSSSGTSVPLYTHSSLLSQR